MRLIRHPLIRALALTLVIGAVAAPVASARVLSDAHRRNRRPRLRF
jgi:hypothetical protein